jgi:hypothetical protein
MVEHMPQKHKALNSNPSTVRKKRKDVLQLGLVVHAYNPSTQGAEAGGP